MDWLILLAGGSGHRAGEGENKVYRSVAGAPLLAYSLRAIRAFPTRVRLVVVDRKDDRSLLDKLLVEFSDLGARVVLGGTTRHRSEFAGLSAIAVNNGDLVGIHDGARPFLTAELWESLRAQAAAIGGAVPVLEPGPVFRTDGGGLRLLMGICKAQTPQVFAGLALVAAYQQATREGVDTAETVERFSEVKIGTIAGDHRHLKVTTAADFTRAADLVDQWSPERWLTETAS